MSRHCEHAIDCFSVDGPQDRKLDISLNAPAVLSSDPIFFRYAYASSTGTLATLASSIYAFGQCFEGLVSQAFPGSTNAEAEASQRYHTNLHYSLALAHE